MERVQVVNNSSHRVKSFSLSYLCYCILIVLTIYKDSPLSTYLGDLGQSYLPLLSCFGGIILILQNKSFSFNKEIKSFIRMGIWIICISYIAVTVWLMIGKPLYLYQENLLIKPLKICLQYFSFLLFLIVIYHLCKKLSFNEIFTPIVFTLFLLTVICIIENFQMPYAFEAIHANGVFPYYRIRLLTRESSWTTMLIYNFTLLSLFYSFNKRKTYLSVFVIFCGFILALLSGAKSLWVLIGLSILLMFLRFCIYGVKKHNCKHIVIFGIIALCILAVVGLKLFSSILEDLNNYTSTVTRLYTIVIGFIIGLIFPVGIGGGIYIGILPTEMEKHIDILKQYNLNLTEIYSYIYGPTDSGLAVKSGLMQYNMYWGILGTIIILVIFFKLYKKFKNCKIKNSEILTICFIANILMLLILDFTFEFWLVVALLMCLIEKSRKGNKIKNSAVGL